jgi:hypothetical protein
MARRKKQCSNCFWWKKSDLESEHTKCVYGKCYLKPPVVLGDQDGNGWSERPTVHETDICSLHDWRSQIENENPTFREV